MSVPDTPPPEELQFELLEPERDDAAVLLLEDCPELLNGLSARDRLAAARNDPDTDLVAGLVGDDLALIYILRRVRLMNELDLLIVAPGYRGRGFGRSALVDAVRRSGRRPVALECSEALFDYFKSIGCKIVARRRGPAGEIRYRMGAHTPKSKKA